jgi:imidazoleglycerol-phosphate dehydratase
MSRTAEIKRATKETKIEVILDIDGTGAYKSKMPVPFLDHMISHIAKHGNFDIEIKAEGDVEIDYHHTVEDIGIVLGEAFLKAIGDKKGIHRYGHAQVPMDEALAEASIDLSGRPVMIYKVPLPKSTVGDFDAELAEEFFKSFANHSKSTVHINLKYGENAHHVLEAVFKAFARALSFAVSFNPKALNKVPSTKGTL